MLAEIKCSKSYITYIITAKCTVQISTHNTAQLFGQFV